LLSTVIVWVFEWALQTHDCLGVGYDHDRSGDYLVRLEFNAGVLVD
jgi:hypothetical protein